MQLNALQESPYAWLSELLHCFSDGDLNRFSKLCVDRAPQMNSQPALVQNQAKLKEKITIMSFVALVSSCDSESLPALMMWFLPCRICTKELAAHFMAQRLFMD